MNFQEMNFKLREVLEEWDPLRYGIDSYETEIVDVIQALHDEGSDILSLANRIQAIYEFSFEELIPLNKCKNMANTLILIQQQASCEL
jgi:hypothetical protein